MTDLLAKTDVTDPATTDSDFQDGIGAMYDFLSEGAMSSTRDAQTIATGVITPVKGFIVADTEAAAATDNLDNILVTSLGAKVIFLRGTSAARVITIRHNQGGTGQVTLLNAVPAILDTVNKVICLSYNTSTTSWEELWRSWGLYVPSAADKTAAKTALSMGTASAVDTGTSPGNVPLISDLGALAFLGSTTVALGGTGRSTLTAHALMMGNGTGAMAMLAAAAAGLVLTSTGTTTDPSYQAPAIPAGTPVITVSGSNWKIVLGAYMLQGGLGTSQSSAGGAVNTFGWAFGAVPLHVSYQAISLTQSAFTTGYNPDSATNTWTATTFKAIASRTGSMSWIAFGAI